MAQYRVVGGAEELAVLPRRLERPAGGGGRARRNGQTAEETRWRTLDGQVSLRDGAAPDRALARLGHALARHGRPEVDDPEARLAAHRLLSEDAAVAALRLLARTHQGHAATNPEVV